MMFDLDLKEITITMMWGMLTQQICYHKYTRKTKFMTVVYP